MEHNKTEWGYGPWQNEPDRFEWIDEITKYPCLAKRGGSGNWCGYVGIPQSHKFYASDYSEIPLDVHGGLTYSNECDGDPENGICHKSEEDDVWWLGFDTAHSGDYIPAFAKFYSGYDILTKNETYKTLEFVKNECASLANQLKEIENSGG